MPKIVKKWGVEKNKLVLIESCHHDLQTLAFEFATREDMEKFIKNRCFPNPYITYIIPILGGEVESLCCLNLKDVN